MLTTKFLGLTLQSPIIAGSSSLTSSYETIKSYSDAGVGAVVLKSIFEEQISGEVDSMLGYADSPEMFDYLSAYVKDNDLTKTITLIEECKKNLPIAVIASINCHKKGEWIDFCSKMENAGADAIELNIFLMPSSKNQSSAEIEAEYFEIVASVTEKVSIPVCVKLTNRFTNHIYVVNELYKRGAKGVTMFNRFWEPDFDIDSFEIKAQTVLSNSNESRSNLRLVSQAAGEVSTIDFSVSTGVHSSEDVIKYILAGASTVQLCSVLYKDGAKFIEQANAAIKEWMEGFGYDSIDDFKARMSSKNFKESAEYQRCQFMKQFGGFKY
ncbi:MAG: dihydroorotate dehydrogenase-like protein [Rikenellaceae bacterium]